MRDNVSDFLRRIICDCNSTNVLISIYIAGIITKVKVIQFFSNTVCEICSFKCLIISDRVWC